MKLDLGCGKSLKEGGFTGVDFIPLKELWHGGIPPEYDGLYLEHNLLSTPWPFETSSIDEIYSSHFVEHIPHAHPNWDANVDGWWVFFAELWRVIKPDGKVTIRHPFSRSDRAFWDPTHTRYIHYQTWFYLNKEFREGIGTDHYVPMLDFEVVTIDALGTPSAMEQRNEATLEFARQFYFNPTEDLVVELKALK